MTNIHLFLLTLLTKVSHFSFSISSDFSWHSLLVFFASTFYVMFGLTTLCTQSRAFNCRKMKLFLEHYKLWANWIDTHRQAKWVQRQKRAIKCRIRKRKKPPTKPSKTFERCTSCISYYVAWCALFEKFRIVAATRFSDAFSFRPHLISYFMRFSLRASNIRIFSALFTVCARGETRQKRKEKRKINHSMAKTDPTYSFVLA